MIRLSPIVAFGLVTLIAAGPAAAQDIAVDAGRGPITVNVPPGYDPAQPAPLVLLLHGYTSSGAAQELYMQFTPLSDARGFLFAAPDGTVDPAGDRFWNATDACCDFYGSQVDDSGYLRGFIEAVQGRLSVDPKRIYIVGHSNGAFMSYRMACDHADLIAAIAPLSGMTWLDPTACQPSEPVSVLHMHGTGDMTVSYEGGCFSGEELCYPGAEESLELWADYNGCRGRRDFIGTADFDASRSGEETRIYANEDRCPEGGSLQLWRMARSRHVPPFTDAWNDAVIDFFEAHPKP